MHREDLLNLQVNGIIPLHNIKEVLILSEEELYQRLVNDLVSLKLPVEEINLVLRPYSSTYYGRYFPSSNKVFIYPYKNEKGEFLDYSDILCTTIHEMVHHIQHQDPTFVRRKGVMHNPQFWCLYNHFVSRAVKLGIISRKEVIVVGC